MSNKIKVFSRKIGKQYFQTDVVDNTLATGDDVLTTIFGINYGRTWIPSIGKWLVYDEVTKEPLGFYFMKSVETKRVIQYCDSLWLRVIDGDFSWVTDSKDATNIPNESVADAILSWIKQSSVTPNFYKVVEIEDENKDA